MKNITIEKWEKTGLLDGIESEKQELLINWFEDIFDELNRDSSKPYPKYKLRETMIFPILVRTFNKLKNVEINPLDILITINDEFINNYDEWDKQNYSKIKDMEAEYTCYLANFIVEKYKNV